MLKKHNHSGLVDKNTYAFDHFYFPHEIDSRGKVEFLSSSVAEIE